MPSSLFTGQTAIVTGAATGIGFGIARYLVEQGATVVLNDIDPAAAADAVDELNSTGPGTAFPFVGNAGEVDFVYRLVDYAAGLEDTTLSMIVANAGLTEFGDFFEFSEDSFDRLTALNLKGTFFLVQAAARHFRREGTAGRIVLIGSNVGNRAYPDLGAYGMSKAGIAMLAQQLTLDLAPLGITINCVAPGAVLTERTEKEEPDYAGIWATLNPVGRVGLPADVAAAVGFLLGPGGGHISGQQLLVDGGWSAYAASPQFVDRIREGAKKPHI
ncbi:3-oxoacyl-[acyl-carrier protein] reductase [Lewinella marina]|uniref:Short-chain dehydrogenase n=1 Tax=Neolewinella marina TaxID=438751 RepID=A0A2G0CJK0_9BACT|nr:SDR family NAD(P)-dependent oxidoreductase [Neolewinella marina]NJB84681.1 3-oxoacyl-[acyl-carrier protein] reductase [Neolewinella marina]PHL00149.1 short-chain dehydrogenase [Neolewinella marina]